VWNIYQLQRSAILDKSITVWVGRLRNRIYNERVCPENKAGGWYTGSLCLKYTKAFPEFNLVLSTLVFWVVTAFIFRAEDGDSMSLRNVGYLPTTPHSILTIKPTSTSSPPWEPEISSLLLCKCNFYFLFLFPNVLTWRIFEGFISCLYITLVF
jgi:hypothetical protein